MASGTVTIGPRSSQSDNSTPDSVAVTPSFSVYLKIISWFFLLRECSIWGDGPEESEGPSESVDFGVKYILLCSLVMPWSMLHPHLLAQNKPQKEVPAFLL
jgi:hypothetical protein